MWQYLETLAVLALASGPEAYAQCDSQTEDQRHKAEGPERAILLRLARHGCMLARLYRDLVAEQEQW